MAEVEIILLLVKGLAVLLAAGLFVRFLCDEYLRGLEFRGLIRRRAAAVKPERPGSSVAKKNP
jgi:hypothetical protein